MSRRLDWRLPVNISKSLKTVRFPAHKADLLRHAQKEGAKDTVLGAIEDLPDGNYASMADVITGARRVE